MAKKKTDTGLDDIFRRTEPPAAEGKEPTPLGVKLTQAEIDQLTQAAAELGVSRHRLLQYVVRDFLRRLEAGEKPRTKTVTKTETVLDM